MQPRWPLLIAGVAALGMVLLGLLVSTAGVLAVVHHAATRPRTYQATVAQLLERHRIAYRTLDLVAVCPSDGEVCLGWHVNLTTGAPPPTYGWLACRQPADSCRFSLPTYGLHALAVPAPVAEPPWLRVVRRQVRAAQTRWGPLGVAPVEAR